MSDDSLFGINQKSFKEWKKSHPQPRTAQEVLSDPKTWEKIRELVSRPCQPSTWFVSPKVWDSLVEWQELENKWRKLPKHLYNQRWLKYNLKNKIRIRKQLPLPE